MHNTIFTEISLLLVFSAGISLLMRFLRQPLIIGYILTGILVGPSVLNLVGSPETIEIFGHFGIALLLFIVGLGLNPKVIKEVGRVSLLTGVGQVLFTTIIAFFATRGLGYNTVTSLYIAIALAFSSTIIILKLLSDKKEQNKLYGKISIGFLLVQDLIATIALLVASSAGSGGLDYAQIGELAGKGVALGLLVFLATKFIVKPLSTFIARSQEMLFLFAIAWGFGVGTVFYELGFSLEVGALVAGIALSTMAYAQEVGSRLRPLRDFFIVVFFIALGAKLDVASLAGVLMPGLGLSALVLFGNPIIVMTIMGLLGYTKKNSFKAGLAVAQISEFSLIFVLLGHRVGQVSQEAVSLVTVVAIVTIAISSYMIIYADNLYLFLERYLKLFERRKLRIEHDSRQKFDIVLIGYHRGGQEYIKVFEKLTKRYIVVDYDPDAIDEMDRKQIPYMYGDVTDPEFLEELDLSHVHLLVSNTTDHSSNTFILNHMEQTNPNAVVICHADTPEQAAELYGLGASYVTMPHYIGSEKISAFIRKNGFKKSEFKRFRDKHIAYLQTHYDSASEIEA